MIDFPPEKLWPIYEKLSKDLQEAIFSEETADNISDICARNDIKEEKISEIAKYTGYVLLGVLTTSEFQAALETELNLDKSLAKKVFQEITQFIFLPVKESLMSLFQTEIVSSTSPEVKKSENSLKEKKSGEKDFYREPVE